MKRDNNIKSTGLILGDPCLIAGESSFAVKYFYYLCTILLGIYGAYGCFYTAIPLNIYWWIVILCALLFSAVFTALFLLRRYRVFLIIFLVLFIAALLFMRDLLLKALQYLIQGFSHTVNAVILAYSEKSNYDFIILPLKPAEASEITAADTVFAIIVLLLFNLFISWFLIRGKNAFMCILLTVPFIASPLVFVIIPDYSAVTSLLIFWAFLLLNTPPGQRKMKITHKGMGHNSSLFYTDRDSTAHPSSFILIPVLALCLILVGAAFPIKNYHRSDFIKDLRSGLISGPNISFIFNSGGVAGNTNRVNLKVTGNISFTEEIVLRVKTTNKDTDYLKGFVGSVYTGQSWEALPEEDYQELNAIISEWKVQRYPGLFKKILPSDYIDKNLFEYKLSVRNEGGNPRCIYTPYGLISGPEELADIDFVYDGFLKSGNSIFGTNEYSLNAVSVAEANNQYTAFYYRIAGIQELPEGLEWYDFDNAQQIDEWTMPEQTRELLSNDQLSLAQNAQEYTRFAYSHYTQIPENLQDILKQYRQGRNLDTEHYQWPYQLAEAIIRNIQEENTYTLSPGTTPSGSDFVGYFLLENHKGYCVHFASAAVMLLRSAGIPARYAEGYTITPGDYQNQNGWMDIPDSKAHAWVEIYLSGIGWIPVEATPGINDGETDESTDTLDTEAYGDDTSDEPGTSTGSSDDTREEDNNEETATEFVNTEDIYRDRSSSDEILYIAMRVFFTAASISLLPAFLLTNKKLRIISRNKNFSQSNRNKAAIAVYEYIQKLLPYTDPARNYSVSMPEYLYNLVLKARFSQHILSETEMLELLNYAKKLAVEARIKSPMLRRFIGRYIYALF